MRLLVVTLLLCPIVTCFFGLPGKIRHVGNGMRVSEFSMSSLSSTDASLLAVQLPWGILSVRGPDRLSFLHGLGTNGFTTAAVGTTRYTSFSSAHGKLYSCVRCLVTSHDIKIICETDTVMSLFKYLHSRIFPSDQVDVIDESNISAVSLLCLFPTVTTSSAPPMMQQPPQQKSSLILEQEDSRRSDVRYDFQQIPAVGSSSSSTDSGSIGDGVLDVYRLPSISELGRESSCLASLLCLIQQQQSTAATSSPKKASASPPPATAAATATNLERINLAVQTSLPTLLTNKKYHRTSTSSSSSIVPMTSEGQSTVSLEVWPVIDSSAATAIYDHLRLTSGKVSENDWTLHNITVLEAGLMHTIDFRKGCFVGQEAITKTLSSTRRNVDGSAAAVRRRLASISIPAHTVTNLLDNFPLSGVGGGDMGVDTGVCMDICAGDELIDEEGSVVGVVLCVTNTAKVASHIGEAGPSTVIQCTMSNSNDDSIGSGSGSGMSIHSSESKTLSNEDSQRVWKKRLGGDHDGGTTSTCLVLLKASYVVLDTPSTSTFTPTTDSNNDNNDLSLTISSSTSSSSASASASPVPLFIRSHLHPSAPLTSVTSWTSADDSNSFGSNPGPLRIVPVSFATYDTAYSPAPPVEKIMPSGVTPAAVDAAVAATKAAEEAARKELKLAEMAKRVAALQKKKAQS